MHDIKAIREAPEVFDRGLARRGLNPLSEQVVRIDQALRAAQTALQSAQSRRNDASKLIGAAKARKDHKAHKGEVIWNTSAPRFSAVTSRPRRSRC